MQKTAALPKDSLPDKSLLAELDAVLRELRRHRQHIQKRNPELVRLRASTNAALKRIQAM